MTASPLQAPYSTFFDSNGDPLNGGLVYTYIAGTTTPKASYTSSTGLISNTNPVVLDSAGRADIWLIGTYRIDVKTSTGTLIHSTDNFTAFSSGGDMTAAVYDPAGIAQQLVGLTAVQTLTNKTLTNPNFTAGTASVAANTYASGTNLTSPVAGSTEYDGKVQYFTPIATQRGIIPAIQEYIVDSNILGADVNTAQSVFGVGVTLSASTRYNFEATYILSKTAGASSHTVGTLFGGTATFNNFVYDIIQDNNTSNLATLTAPTMASSNVATILIVTGAIASANSYINIKIRGTVSVNAGGTLIPQYKLSAAPGGAYLTFVGSYFGIWPTGASGANINVGTWA